VYTESYSKEYAFFFSMRSFKPRAKNNQLSRVQNQYPILINNLIRIWIHLTHLYRWHYMLQHCISIESYVYRSKLAF